MVITDDEGGVTVEVRMERRALEAFALALRDALIAERDIADAPR